VITSLALVLAGGAAWPVVPPAQAMFRCPAPVPVVGDTRRTQVDAVFFGVMRRAEAAGAMPVQADVDAELAAEAIADAQAQSDTYTVPNRLLYTLHPGGRPGFRVAYYTGETWGYVLEQRTLDAPPTVTDSEATFRTTGGDLADVRAVARIARGWQLGSAVHGFPTASTLVADARRHGVDEGRIVALAASGDRPREGWVGVWTGDAGAHLVVRGRTCSKIATVDLQGGRSQLGVERRPARPLACPANVRVPLLLRRTARRVFDEAMASALAASRTSPDASDIAAALTAVGVTATDEGTIPDATPLTDGLAYEVGPGRFAVTRRVPGGGSYRIEWEGLDLPVLVRDTNTARDDAATLMAWQVDRLAAAVHRSHARLPKAASVRALHPAGVLAPRVAMAHSSSRVREGTIGVWVRADHRIGLVRGVLCGVTTTDHL
jgi:hypothetical protein